MKKTFTIQNLPWTASAFLALFALLSPHLVAQLNVAAVNNPYTITFDATMAGVHNGAFTGTGFDAVPLAGQLNSNAWATTGMSDTTLVFGGSATSGDYARGNNNSPTSGGFYMYNATNIGSNCLGIKPGGTDWTPGTLTLRVQNTTGAALTSLDVAYELWNNNSQSRANSLNFSWSTDDVTYTDVSALDFTSPEASDVLGFVVSNKSTSITGISVANNGYVYLRWTGDDATGGGSRDEFGLDDISVTGHGGTAVNTSVQFTATSSTAAENGGTTNLTLSITDADALNATSVDVVLISGDAARINNYTTQTATFPAGSSADETVTLTLTDNSICDGDAALSFQLQNISGGQGTAYIGANDGHALALSDNEAPADPVTTAGTAIGSNGFTANWNAVNGATNYRLDVYTSSATVEDDFNDGDFSANPTWTGSTTDYAVITDATLPNGNASTDGSFLAANASVGTTTLLMPSSETAEWKFSWGSGDFNPSGANNFGVVLMSDAIMATIDDAFNGYYLRIGTGGSTDAIELWNSTGATKTQVGSFPASPVVGNGALQDGLDLRITRSNTGEFELFYATGFTYTATPTTSAGTLTDNTYTSSNYFGLYTDFANPSGDRRGYMDNVVLGGSAAYVPGYENFDAGTATSQVIAGLDPLTTYHFVVRSTGGCSTGENSNVTDVTTLAGANPALTAGTLTDFGALCIGAEGGPSSFTVDGFNLTTADVTVGPLSGFTFSTTELGTYTASLSIAQPGGSFTQDIWVKFMPTAEQSYSGDIPVGGGGASGIQVAVTGSGLNTVAIMSTGGASNVGSEQAEAAGTLDDTGCSALTGYGIEYSTTENFTPGTGTQEPSTNIAGGNFSSVLTGLSPCTIYYFLAYGTNNGGTAYGAQGSFETGPIASTTATTPSVINQEDFTATWDAAPGATGYRLDVSTSPLFGNPVSASDLFFSEYVEGSGSTKYLEIYNGTGSDVDLSNYELRRYSNGDITVTSSETLSGTLPAGATIVYANASATAYGGTVVTSAVINFNGNDAMALYNTATGSFADIFGTIGHDPGSAWNGTNGRTTKDGTLVRNADVAGGVTSNPAPGFPSLDAEWTAFGENDVSHLGTHDFNNLAPSFLPGYEDLAVAGTSQAVTGLNISTTYYYRVRVESGTCISANSNTIAVTTLACPGNAFIVSINTDANGSQTTWEVLDGSNAVVAAGGPYTGQDNTLITESVCLGTSPVSACYLFRIYDSFGDGLTGVGNWKLRTTDGSVMMADDFASGYRTPSFAPQWAGYGEGHAFCLPLGSANIAPTECGIFTNGPGNKVYCNKVTGATLYQFEFTDPDAGYARRQARPTNRIHFWDLDPYPLTPGVTYFARVRTNVAGPLASAHFGSGCEMGLAVTVPCTQLISAPNYGHSCNETREFGRYGFIYATPVPGADAYEFRIYNLGEGYDQTFTRSTYILHLKWPASEAPGLANGSTYNVDVNVINGGVESGFCGTTCTITIQNAANFAGQLEQTGFGAATLWPNPVRDGMVNLNISGLSAGSPTDDPAETDQQIADDPAGTDQQITVEVQDIYGKQVFAREFGNSGESFSTVLQLPSNIASGVYMVNITVNGERTVQRLSVIR